MRKLRVGLVSLSTINPTQYGLTGNTPLLEIARDLSIIGHDVKVISTEISDLSGVFEIEGIEFHSILPYYLNHIGERGLEANHKLLQSLRRYVELVSDFDIDVIHVQFNPVPALLRLWMPDKKFLFDVQAPFVRMLDETRLYQTSSFPIRKPLFLERLCEKFAYRLCDKVVVPTESFRKGLKDWGLAPGKRTVVIPEGVNEELFKPSDHKLPHPTVVYEGSITPFRGIEALIDAFHLVKEQIPEAKMIIVGGTFDNYLSELEAKLRTINLLGDVVITGYVPYQKVAEIIRRAHVGVSPVPPLEVYRVSFPLKVLEYMASGLPVVATRGIAGHMEVLDPEYSEGVHFSAPSIATGILRFLRDIDGARSAGRKARKKVERVFAWKTIAQRYSDLYDEMWQ